LNWARLLGVDKPNVGALARDGDVDGLIAAAHYKEVVRRVDGRVSDAGAPVREEAIAALCEHAGDRAGEILLRALGDPADRVRCAAVVGLYERRDVRALAAAAATLRPQDGEAHTAACSALLELHAPGATEAFVSALLERDGDRPVDESEAVFVEALLEAEGPAALQSLTGLLMGALAGPREAVADRAEDLAELLAPATVEPLVSELATGSAPLRAASALGRIRDARALEPLVAALGHPDPAVRRECCVALGELRDPIASEPLLRATRDPEHTVRAGAGAALDRIGTAAVAVSVASLLRPLLDAAPAATRAALEAETLTLVQGDADAEDDAAVGPNATLLRRLARFIGRVEDARSARQDLAPASGHNGSGIVSRPRRPALPAATPVVAFNRGSRNGNGRFSESVAWPASTRSSASSSGARED
jgi:HEAT repeat protein